MIAKEERLTQEAQAMIHKVKVSTRRASELDREFGQDYLLGLTQQVKQLKLSLACHQKFKPLI